MSRRRYPNWINIARGYFSGKAQNALARKGIRILFYHGVVDRFSDPILDAGLFLRIADFKSQLAFLKRFKILDMNELASEVSNKKISDKPAVVITFDDGFANNLIAADILSSLRIPWCIFITTDALGSGRTIWTSELSLLILHGEAKQLDLLDRIWSFQTREERVQANRNIKQQIKAMPAEERMKTMTDMRRQFPAGELERLLDQFPSRQMLSWDDVSQLSNAGIEIGSHGVSHEIHHAHQTDSVCSLELENSKREIENKLNRSCRYFAFPNGDFHPKSEQGLRKAGYELGFTTVQKTVVGASNPMLLPRMNPVHPLDSYVREFFWEKSN
jgi:peptidoglycan/xylan/chitin deacetylase (PgdA/CDA1 family)